MAARDLSAFRRAGETLARLGLVRASEGNLSTFDGRTLAITRTGCRLGELRAGDVLTGTLDEPPADASSDLAIHVAAYRERGAGAFAHAHPQGTVPEGWIPGEPHGTYAFADTLEEAVAALARDAGVG
ncbi:MAG: class II aldolase/adducin family protein [Planctomycetaceae bacterium]